MISGPILIVQFQQVVGQHCAVVCIHSKQEIEFSIKHLQGGRFQNKVKLLFFNVFTSFTAGLFDMSLR